MSGPYRLCLTNKTLSLIRLNHTEPDIVYEVCKSILWDSFVRSSYPDQDPVNFCQCQRDFILIVIDVEITHNESPLKYYLL